MAEKEFRSEIPKQYSEEDSGWLKCNTEPRKTSRIFALQEQMVETRAWKKIGGFVECDNCRLCGAERNSAPPLVWVYKASRKRKCQTTQKYFESSSSKIGYGK